MLKDTKKNDKNFLNKKNLSHFITKRTGHILGECTVTSEIRNFPIITQASSSLISERLILLAETAHVLPPIGAQGLNTSIHDIKNLFNLIEKKLKNNEEIGDNVFLKIDTKEFDETIEYKNSAESSFLAFKYLLNEKKDLYGKSLYVKDMVEYKKYIKNNRFTYSICLRMSR